MIKRILVSIFACVIVLLNLIVAGTAQAQPLLGISFPSLQKVEVSEQQKELLKQLEADVLPQIDRILSPEQREKFKTAVVDGTSFRKAFKLLSLTPDQKVKLGTLFKSLPKKDIFASLTPEQKKELFTPTPEEISQKISEKLNMAKDKEGGLLTPAEIGQKISENMMRNKIEE